jgi:D-alanine-D-alanine ligase
VLPGASKTFINVMIQPMKILVLGGGTSPEREISLQSSAAVRAALESLHHTVTYLDAAEGDEAILAAAKDVELIMPILHGPGGEDGEIQALLERTGKPYLGSGVEASQRCINKVIVKELLLQNGLPTARFAVVTKESFATSPIATKPFVLKPVDDGSSVGLLVVRELPYDQAKVDELFSHHSDLLLEELVVGTEITVPILGTEVMPIVEIMPPAGESFDYENKYNGHSTELCPPQHVTKEVQEQAQALAMKIHTLVGARHLSRTDMIVRPDGSIMVLEINTLPGMTSASLYPKSAAAAGYDFEKLVARFVELSTAK